MRGSAPLAMWGKIDSDANDNSSTGSMLFTLLHLPGTELPLPRSRKGTSGGVFLSGGSDGLDERASTSPPQRPRGTLPAAPLNPSLGINFRVSYANQPTMAIITERVGNIFSAPPGSILIRIYIPLLSLCNHNLTRSPRCMQCPRRLGLRRSQSIQTRVPSRLQSLPYALPPATLKETTIKAPSLKDRARSPPSLPRRHNPPHPPSCRSRFYQNPNITSHETKEK